MGGKEGEYLGTLKLSPSILSSDFSKLGEVVSFLDRSACDYIHVDVMDGHFVPNLTFGHGVVESIRKYTQKPFDVHLMLSNPSVHLKDFIKSGSDILSIHVEIHEDCISLLRFIREKGKKSGLVYRPDTPLDGVDRYFPYVDQILLMTVEPGFGGQSFMTKILSKIKDLRERIERSPFKGSIDIEVDGGINLDTQRACREKGANVFVVGNFIFKEPSWERRLEVIQVLKGG